MKFKTVPFLALALVATGLMGCRTMTPGTDNEPLHTLPKRVAEAGPDAEDPEVYNLGNRPGVAPVTTYVNTGRRGETILAQFVKLDGDVLVFQAYGQLAGPGEHLCAGELNGTLLNSEEFQQAYPGPKVVVVDVQGRKLGTLNLNVADGEVTRVQGRLQTDRLKFVNTQRVAPLGVRVEDGTIRRHFRLPSGSMATVFPLDDYYDLMERNIQTLSIWGTYEDGSPTSISPTCTNSRRVKMDDGTTAWSSDWAWAQSTGPVKVFALKRPDGTCQFATVNLDLIEDTEAPQQEPEGPQP